MNQLIFLIFLILVTFCVQPQDVAAHAVTTSHKTTMLSPADIGSEQQNDTWIHHVPRISRPVRIDSNWDKAPWRGFTPLRLENYMGDLPEHRPGVEVKVAHDEESIYVIFKVDDQYVHCIVDEYQGPVYRDSCVEFFFTPSTDLSNGYFNLEVNCGGTALFHFQKEGGQRVRIPRSEFDKIELAASMPRIVDPEIQDPVTWTLEYRIPIAMLEQYTQVERPGSGVEWRANFYKIADRTSHPHWLTWSFVDHPTPRFHMPEYFGTLRFE